LKTIKNITVIGTGNVALQFSKLFLKNKFKIDGIYGRSNFSDSQIDNHLYTDKVSNISKNSDLYLVAVSDDSYLELLKKIPLKNKFIVHTSGSLVSEMLNSFSKRWGCLYPLQTIKKNQQIEWDNIPFYIEASNNNDLELLTNFCYANNLHCSVKNSTQRNKTHIAAVATNNFIYYLLSTIKEYCEKNKINFKNLKPLLDQSLNNVLNFPAHQLQTGPAIRKDLKLIEKHIESLKSEKDLKEIYQLFSEKIIKKHHEL
tara:strand:- start:3761 stop:4534 length:774 start_codon:yes stop_codon:yes gene_type:complete